MMDDDIQDITDLEVTVLEQTGPDKTERVKTGYAGQYKLRLPPFDKDPFAKGKMLINQMKRYKRKCEKRKNVYNKWLYEGSTSSLKKPPKAPYNFRQSLLNMLPTLNRLQLCVTPTRIEYAVMCSEKRYVIDIKQENIVLECIMDGQVPYTLMPVINQFPLIYQGMCFCEIQDKRHEEPTIKCIILKPTNMCTMLNPSYYDSKSDPCSEKEALRREGVNILNLSEPLCLDPNASVAYVNNYIEYYRNPFLDLSRRLDLEICENSEYSKPPKLNFAELDEKLVQNFRYPLSEVYLGQVEGEEESVSTMLADRYSLSISRAKISHLCAPIRVKTFILKFGKIYKYQVFYSPHDERLQIRLNVDPHKPDGGRSMFSLHGGFRYLDRFIDQLTDIVAQDSTLSVAGSGVTRCGKPYVVFHVVESGTETDKVKSVTVSLEIDSAAMNKKNVNSESYYNYLMQEKF